MRLENRKPYHLSPAGVLQVEQEKHASYMGYWCVKGPRGWNETPVDVFYVANPDRDKGHSNYFGMFTRADTLYICDAHSCFSENITGIVEDGMVYVSRYRHDYVVTPSGFSIDGGRDYMKTSLFQPAVSDQLDLAEQRLHNQARFVTVRVNGGEFEFSEPYSDDDQSAT